jgi:hypothetical protein
MLMMVASAACDEAGDCDIGQSRERTDVETDHVVHLLDVGVEQRRRGPDAGIVDEERDVRVRTQGRFDPCQIRLVVKVGCNRVDGTAGRASQALRQAGKTGLVAGDQDQVVTPMGQTVGINGADGENSPNMPMT